MVTKTMDLRKKECAKEEREGGKRSDKEPRKPEQPEAKSFNLRKEKEGI